MCHARRLHHATAAPEPARPAAPRDPSLRASDAERDAAATRLRAHGAAGRLDVDELEQRIGAAYAARTYGELARLEADLPAAPVRPARARRPDQRRDRDWLLYAQVSALLVAIWAFSGAGHFWPGWVMLWWSLALVLKTAPRGLRPR